MSDEQFIFSNDTWSALAQELKTSTQLQTALPTHCF